MFKESLFSICPDRAIEPVDTAAGRTYVRSLTVGEKDVFDANSGGGTKAVRVHLLIACCCKEDGSPEFTEFDAGELSRLPSHVVEPIVAAAMRVNRFGEGDQETIRKNL
jgi:hypothetical protein